MTRYLGEDGVVQIDGTAVGQITNFDYNETGDRIDMPAMGDTVKFQKAGKPTASGTVTCWADHADAGQLLAVQGATVALILRPLGTGSGLPQRSFAAVDIVTVGETVPVEGGWELSFEFTANSNPDKANQV